MAEREIPTSRVFHAINNAKSKIIALEGSSRSTKTYSILQYLIHLCLKDKKKVTASRQKLTWAKASIIPDFQEIMSEQFQAWRDSAWNKTESIYHFPNGSELSFVGLDEKQKLHGRKQDVFWVNEAVESRYKQVQQLLIRTTERGILDYNPSFLSHWIYDKILTRDDCEFIHSTYKDNPFLEAAVIAEIERLKDVDPVSWQIYGLGKRGAHQGLVFKDYSLKPFPAEAKKVVYGLDFGFTNHPSALVKVGLLGGELYLHQVFYERGLTNVRNPNLSSQASIGFLAFVRPRS